MRTVVSHLWLSSQGLNGARPVPCAFSLSNRRNRQYTASFSLNFADGPIIYSIYSYFLLKSQSSTDPEVLLLCSCCFFFLWIPISVCLHLPSSESLKLHAISQAAWLPNSKRSCLGFLKKSACLENSELTAVSIESLITILLFIYGHAFSSLKGLSALCGSYNILTLSVDINFSKYFCFSVYFLFEVFIFCRCSYNCSFFPFSNTSVTLRLWENICRAALAPYLFMALVCNVLFSAKSSKPLPRIKVIPKTHLWLWLKNKGRINFFF